MTKFIYEYYKDFKGQKQHLAAIFTSDLRLQAAGCPLVFTLFLLQPSLERASILTELLRTLTAVR